MSSSDEGRLVDFKLVSTYVPMMILLGRALFLTLFFQATLLMGQDNTGLLVVLCVVCYFDAYSFKHDVLNKACGFLLPAAFYLYTNTHAAVSHKAYNKDKDIYCSEIYIIVVYWAVDLVWAASSSIHIASLCWKLRIHLRIQTVACVWSLILTTHVMLRCYKTPSFWEVLLRVVLYYVSCMFYFFTSVFLVGVDRNTHHFTVMHVCLHILFVEPYVLLASALISVCVYSKLYWEHFAAHPALSPRNLDTERQSALLTKPDKMPYEDNLLLELRAAQAHHA